jgi:dihydropteroate synthase
MISLSSLLDLASRDRSGRSGRDRPVPPLLVGERSYDLDAEPAIMGCVNLSRDSTYRESVATSTAAAIRKGRVLAAQGADFVDLGAESSTARAARVPPEAQIEILRPVVEGLVADDVVVSVETYSPAVAAAALRAGARIVNYTGRSEQEAVFDLVAEHRATLVLCYVAGDNVRDVAPALSEDPLEQLLEHFSTRIERAREHGVERIVADPGMGFYYSDLVDPRTRAEHQARILLNSGRLRELEVPVCNALPHWIDLFEDQFRVAEGFFAVLADLGGTGVFRTHEVPQVRAVLQAMRVLSPDWPR